jgi:hypothetical protein
VTPEEIIARRLRAQRLSGPPHAGVAEAVGWSGGVQAQVPHEAEWSLGMRTGATAEEVRAAIDSGEIVRTHVLRPTWHYVLAADVRWLQRLTAHRVHQLSAYYYRQAGLDEDTARDAHATLRRLLADGPLMRSELAPHFALGNWELSMALIHAELDCVVVSGPRRGAQHTYLLGDDVLPPAPERSPDADLAALAERYLRSHAPATAEDFAWWSSLTVTDARRALAMVEVADAGEPPPPPAALLLPTYDESLVAYRGLRQIRDGRPDGELLERPLLEHGRYAGTWKRTLQSRRVIVEVTADGPAVRREVDRYGRFVGRPAELRAPG